MHIVFIYQEVTEWANNTTYGLAANVFTENTGRAIRMANAIEAGTINVRILLTSRSPKLMSVFQVNCASSFELGVPFGGYKQSGIGRELGEEALQA
jgi:aldehyde dehydrogenase (NAD+)